MNEIRFRASEDQLQDELYKRRESHKWLGCLHLPCDKCGSYWFVISDPTTMTCECETCKLSSSVTTMIPYQGK